MSRPHQRATPPLEIAPNVFSLEVGNGITRSHVNFVRSGASWVLIDTASAHCGQVIYEAAEALFGFNARPTTMLLTHNHPDHAGSKRELAQRWGCLAYVHPDELVMATMIASPYLPTVKRYANPLDIWVILPLLQVMSRHRRKALLAELSFADVARALDLGAGVSGLPDWKCVPTSGHTSFFWPGDRVLITGDAVVTVDLNSVWGGSAVGFPA